MLRQSRELEDEALEPRSPGERLGDAIARQAGRVWFITAHAVWFGGWIVWNSRFVPWLRAFDPFPYQLLTLVVSLEAIFLSLFILMSQNRANRQADGRAHLDLQINLLAEQESTKMLQMLQSLCAKQGLKEAHDPELENVMRPVKPDELFKEVQENFPEAS